jgi:hypothetical protein
MAWQKLSQRSGGAAPDGPYEGVPAHLKYPLISWLRFRLGTGHPFTAKESLIRTLMIRFRWPTPLNVPWHEHGEELILSAAGGEDRFNVEPWDEDSVTNHEFFLDLIDATLDILGESQNDWRSLERMLTDGDSVWRVSEDRRSFASRVSDEAQAIYDAATSISDDAAKELREAWRNAFGRNGDPSDAWDHAVKAMEALLIPLVVPKEKKPNLGHVVGQLANQGHLWRMILPGKNGDNDVGPLVGMLNGIWPNVDRHSGVPTSRPPTDQEARAAVTLAAAILQWHRDGWVLERR